MKFIETFPHKVREIENLWIEMPDGVKLAARAWLPEGCEQKPVPTILEYIPYRKRDGTAVRDALTHPYFAGHGYACIRLDIRGNGESEGIMEDEYTAQEHADCVDAINWIAEQDWCSGQVGMMGISWGGFNGLQVAALQPEPLKAIITLCSTDDRYADDIHYKGGCLLNENLGWAGTLLSFSSRPPDPAIVGDKWREMWMERLENLPLTAKTWLQHQHRDAYWKHGSVCEDFGAVEAAVLAISGWADAYSNTVFRLVNNLKCPAKGIVGPWAHKYPHFAVPEPRMGFLQEALRWWDFWLKGEPTGVMRDPAYRVYIQDSAPPSTDYEARPGRWVAEGAWPSGNITQLELMLGKGTLSDRRARNHKIKVCSDTATGLDGGEFYVMWLGPEFPGDQARDDEKSVCFDTGPLGTELDICGAPEVVLDISSDKPTAQIAMRLNDVAPDGKVTRITFGVLNLCHRNGHEAPEPLEPGVRYKVRLKLDDIAYLMPEGHRLRLAVSTCYWPLIWPAPDMATLTIHTASSRLFVPARAPLNDDVEPFEPAEAAPPLKLEELRAQEHRREVQELDDATRLTIFDDFGEYRDTTHGLVAGLAGEEVYEIAPDDPLSARATTSWTQSLSRDDGWSVRTEAIQKMHATVEAFHIFARVEAYEGEELVFEKEFSEEVPRNLV
ncbi:MAG: CocE/NonD family hydrolase [Hyphomicrobiales bacterium]